MPLFTIVLVVVGLYFVVSVAFAIALGKFLDNHEMRATQLRPSSNGNNHRQDLG